MLSCSRNICNDNDERIKLSHSNQNQGDIINEKSKNQFQIFH
jgi:hypothetical protein